MEEYFDMEMSVRVKTNFDKPDCVWLLCRGEYVPFKRERTCHWVGIEEWENPVECSECGVLVIAHVALDSNYCPNCGAKVVEE